MKGMLTATGNIGLGGNTLTLTSTGNVTHVVDGNITASSSGSLVFSTGSANGHTVILDRSGAGALNVPAVQLMGANTLSIATANATSVVISGSLTDQESGTINVVGAAIGANVVDVKGDVVNSANGVIIVGDFDVLVEGSVLNNGNVAASGSNIGNINFNNTTAGNTVTVNNNITNNAVVTGSVGATTTRQNIGNIVFAGEIVPKGNVTNNVDVQVSTTSNNACVFQNAGNISFPNVAIVVTGATENKSVKTVGSSTSGSTFDNCANILFGNVATNVGFNGGLTNSSSGYGSDITASGRVAFLARAAGTVTVGTSVVSKNLTNSSANTGTSTNGDINLNQAATGAVTIYGTISLEGTSGNGDILLGAGPLVTAGVSVTKGVSGSQVALAADGGVATTHALGSFSMSAGTFSVGALTNAASAINISVINMSGGTAVLGGGASVAAVSVTGNVSMTGGTLDFGTGARNFNLSGVTADFSGASFANGASTTMIFNRGISGQTLKTGANTTWNGNLTVSNTFPVAPIFSFSSGNFNIGGVVTFTDNGSTTDGIDLANGRIILLGAGNVFVNNEGYTATSGVITFQGAAAQVATGTGNFYSVECNNAAGLTFGVGATIHTINGTLYLTNGTVSANAAATINFQSAASNPTIVRSAGVLNPAATVTLTTPINVVYTGTAAITTGAELPTTATGLNNLSVFTSGGNQVVTVAAAINPTVNGILTVNSGQTLALVANTLNMSGTSIVNNGTITDNGTGYILLQRGAGTAITGAGKLTRIDVANNSVGNSISGSVGLATNAGAVGTGNLTLLGATSGSITLAFTGNGPHINVLTTNANTGIVLGANLLVGGNIIIGNSTVNLVSYALSFQGTANTIDANAVFSGTGKLVANGSAATTLDAVAGGNPFITSNFEMNMNAAGTTLSIGSVNAADMTVAGSLILTKGNLVVNTPRLVKVTGNAISLTSNSTVTGTGTLVSSPDTGRLALSLAGATTIANLTVNGNTDLSSTNNSPLTISNTLTHSAGEFAFGAINVNVQTTFTRTSNTATYSATTGELIIGSATDAVPATFTQGSSFSIPNLTFLDDASLTVGSGADFTVTRQFKLNVGAGNTLTHTVANSPRLHIDDGAMVVYTSGTLDVAPVYAGSIMLIANNSASGAIPATVWPAAPTTLVTTYQLNAAGGAAVAIDIPDNRSVSEVLDLRVGVLDLSASQKTLTMTGSTVRRRQGGSVNLGSGQLVFNNPPDVIYEPSLASAGGDITTGKELPGTVNNLTFTRSASVGNAVTTVTSAVTVNGKLTISNSVVTNSAISTKDTVTVAANVTTTFNAPLSFIGSADQIISIPGAVGFGSLNINKDNSTNTVTVVGGSIFMSAGSNLGLANGLLVIPSPNFIQLDNPVGSVAQGYTHTAGVGGTLSHVVGNVQKMLKAGTITALGRNEFPVGDMQYYRPVAITTLNPLANITLGVAVTINEQNTPPTGTAGLPINSNAARYPGFYWNISSGQSLGSTIFDLELTAQGFTDYTNISDVRIIRRIGTAADEANMWSLQGENYDNFVSAGIPSVVNINSTGGIRPEGAIFTYGLPSSIIPGTIPAQTLTVGGAPKVIMLTDVFSGGQGQLTKSATSSNTAIVTAATSGANGDSLTITPVAQGQADISVKAVDETGDFGTTVFHVTVNPVTKFPVSGIVTYDNTAGTPLAGVVVSVGGMTDTTDATGAYRIEDVPNGSYTVTASSSADWPGANATDALGVANNFAGIITLTGLKLDAADVNNSGTANNTDALLILLRFANPSTVFAKGNWVFSSANITVAGAEVIQNVKGLGVGDVNGSNTPSLAKKATIELSADGALKVNPKEAFEVPIKVAADMNISAISLRFTYPADLVTYEGVSSKANNIVEGKNEGSVTLAWADLSCKAALDLKADETLLVLKFKPTENFKAGSKFDVTLDGAASELASKDGSVISAALKAAAVEAYIPTEFALRQNYPNPFNPSTTIQYDLPLDSRVNITVYNSLGQQVTTLVNQEQSAGVYKVNFNASELTSGIYFYRINVNAGERSFTQTHKMILMK